MLTSNGFSLHKKSLILLTSLLLVACGGGGGSNGLSGYNVHQDMVYELLKVTVPPQPGVPSYEIDIAWEEQAGGSEDDPYVVARIIRGSFMSSDGSGVEQVIMGYIRQGGSPAGTTVCSEASSIFLTGNYTVLNLSAINLRVYLLNDRTEGFKNIAICSSPVNSAVNNSQSVELNAYEVK